MIYNICTVAEFAKKVNVGRSTIYKKIDKELSLFCRNRNNKKVISEKALKLFNIPQETNIDVYTATLVSQLEQKDKQISQYNTQINDKNSELERKNQQLSEKDLQLARKDEQIKKLQEQIPELTKAFREAQALHAATLQKQLTDETENKHRWWKFWRKKGK